MVSYQPQPSGVTRPAPPSLDLLLRHRLRRCCQARFEKYATFTGRASRSEYWWWALFTFTGYLVLGLLAFALGTATSRDGGRTPGLLALPLIILFAVFLFGILIPTLAVTVRRLHDAGTQTGCAAPAHPLPGSSDHHDLRLVAELTGWSQVRPGPGNRGSSQSLSRADSIHAVGVLTEVTGAMP